MGKPWKIIVCKDCKKRFTSDYAKKYHTEHARLLCPVVRDMTMGELIERSKETESND